jgi:voltage-dependent calcium channel alpha-2/delta-4
MGENWKIHPDWVYCRYHYLENHEFDKPEDELRHFLRKIVEKDWKWSQQYEPDPETDKKRDNNDNCK